MKSNRGKGKHKKEVQNIFRCWRTQSSSLHFARAPVGSNLKTWSQLVPVIRPNDFHYVVKVQLRDPDVAARLESGATSITGGDSARTLSGTREIIVPSRLKCFATVFFFFSLHVFQAPRFFLSSWGRATLSLSCTVARS